MGKKEGRGHAGCILGRQQQAAVAEAVVQLVVVVDQAKGPVRLDDQVGLVPVALAQHKVVQGSPPHLKSAQLCLSADGPGAQNKSTTRLS